MSVQARPWKGGCINTGHNLRLKEGYHCEISLTWRSEKLSMRPSVNVGAGFTSKRFVKV
jgi:hypothetical protein